MRIGMICLLFVFSASLGSAETSVTVGGGSYWSSLPAPSPFLFTKVDNKYAEAFDPFDGDWQPGPLVTVSGDYRVGTLLLEAHGFATWTDLTQTTEIRGSPAADVDRFERDFAAACQLPTVGGFCPGSQAKVDDVIDPLLEKYPDIRFVGWSGIDGNLAAGVAFRFGDPVHITTTRKFSYHGVDLVAGEFFPSMGATVFVGPSYKRIRQLLDVFAYESNRDPSIHNTTMREDIDAWYLGALIGAKTVTPMGWWSLTFDGRVGLYYLDADYEGMRTTVYLTPPPLTIEGDHAFDRSILATAVKAKLGVQVPLFAQVAVHVDAGMDYLSHVPVLRYHTPELSHGETLRLDFVEMLGVQSTAAVVWRF